MMKRKLLTIMAVMMLCGIASAQVKLPEAIADGMVLQQQTKVNVWGWADPGDKIKVTASWGSKAACQVDADGRWITQLQTPAAGGPYEITVSDGKPVVISDVLIGEVWICSGQSNMELRMKGNPGQPVNRSLEEIMYSGRYQDRIRFFQISKIVNDKPCEDVPEGEWKKCNPVNSPEFSALGYYFAKHLTEVLGVPVGIISNSWGASSIEAWMPEEILEASGAVENPYRMVQQKNCGIYNAMHSPMRNYVAKGFLWYQGECNRYFPELYSRMMPAMVAHWREIWNAPDMPFYYAQIAPFSYGDSDADFLPKFIEMQVNVRKDIPNCEIIPTNDGGEEFCIHPRAKDVLGLRFAHAALVKTYGLYGEGLPVTGPVMTEVKRTDSGLTVFFDQPLTPVPEGITGFEVAGADGSYHPVEVTVNGKNGYVMIKSDDPASIRAVQYSYRNYYPSNLSNNFGLPAFPFRKVLD